MTHLIDKDTLVEYINLRYLEHQTGNQPLGCLDKMNEDKEILSYLNTLEVKEVGLDFQRFAKEMDAIFVLPSSETKNTEENPLNWEYTIAKRFYELGLKTKAMEE